VPDGHEIVHDHGGGAVVTKDGKTGDMTTRFPEGEPERQARRLAGPIAAAMDEASLVSDDGMVPLGWVAAAVRGLPPDATDGDVMAALSHLRAARLVQGHAENRTQALLDRGGRAAPLGGGESLASATLWDNGRAVHHWTLAGKSPGEIAKLADAGAAASDAGAASAKPAAPSPKPAAKPVDSMTRFELGAEAERLRVPDFEKMKPAELRQAVADARKKRGEAREDRAGLVKKKVQGKDGKTHTVYARPDHDTPADKTGKGGTSDTQPHPADADPPKADSLDLSGVHDDPGVVARVREKVGRILTALARRAYDAALMSPQIIDAAGLLVDTPEDLQKIGYNPATAGADAQKTGNPLQDAGIPLTPYQFVNLCTTVLPGVVSWVKGKLGGGSAAESDDIDALAELLHDLLASLAEEFGFAAPPDAAAIASNLRGL